LQPIMVPAVDSGKILIFGTMIGCNNQ